jgi:outer membrane biosynthesis protein TonB
MKVFERLGIVMVAGTAVWLGACAGPKPAAQRAEGPIQFAPNLKTTKQPMTLSAYRATVNEAIKTQWEAYLRTHMSLAVPGTVKASYTIEPDGRVTRVEILSNTSNEIFAGCTVAALTNAKFPPIPENLRSTLKNGRLETEETFSVY